MHFNDEKVNGKFLSTVLNSTYGKREMRNKIKTSAGQYTISQDGIGAIKSILPPIELQNQFAAFVKQTDKSKYFGMNGIKFLWKLNDIFLGAICE